jgi:hypothetical protein
MSVLNKLADIATSVGRKAVMPDDATSADLAVKKRNLDEYTRATTNSAQAPTNPKKSDASPADRINSSGKYGDRAGEKRLPVYHKGTDYVPKTGPAVLKKGEAVIPAHENPMNPMNPYAKVTEATEKPAKKIKHIVTRKAKSGGYIHEHHHTEPMHHEMQEHVTKNQNDMLAHMKEHMGTAEPEAEPNMQTAAGAQDAAIGAA